MAEQKGYEFRRPGRPKLAEDQKKKREIFQLRPDQLGRIDQEINEFNTFGSKAEMARQAFDLLFRKLDQERNPGK